MMHVNIKFTVRFSRFRLERRFNFPRATCDLCGRRTFWPRVLAFDVNGRRETVGWNFCAPCAPHVERAVERKAPEINLEAVEWPESGHVSAPASK